MNLLTMSGKAITEEAWIKIQQNMQFYGCYCSHNCTSIMKAIFWKFGTGTSWSDISEAFCQW